LTTDAAKKFCEGNALNDPCKANADCDVGAYCHIEKDGSGVCLIQRDIGETCNKYQRCVNWGLCNNTLCV
jgi:Dickkopf N-terminal cysteine-rich region